MSGKCAVIVLACIDHRLVQPVNDHAIAEFGVGNFDLKTDPGIQQLLQRPQDAGPIFNAVKLAIEKHGVKTVAIYAHEDCGAYGGSAAYANSYYELQDLFRDLKDAKMTIVNQFGPQINVKLGIFRFLPKPQKWEFVEIKESHTDFEKFFQENM